MKLGRQFWYGHDIFAAVNCIVKKARRLSREMALKRRSRYGRWKKDGRRCREHLRNDGHRRGFRRGSRVGRSGLIFLGEIALGGGGARE